MEQSALSADGRDLFVKLCGMLGSDHDGERARAARMATSFLQDRSLTWGDTALVYAITPVGVSIPVPPSYEP